MATATIERDVFEEVEPQQNRDANRTVKIALAADDPRKHIDVSWHVGKVGKVVGRRVNRRLQRGESLTMPIGRARAMFGMFTIPTDIENEQDERRFTELSEFFHRERERVLVSWGDYPRPIKFEQGVDAIGPHRFPHIIATVIEDDGTEWEPLDLHEVYRIGEYDAAEHLRPSYHRQLAEEEKAIKQRTLGKDDDRDKEIARLTGIVETLLAQSGKPAPDAKGKS